MAGRTSSGKQGRGSQGGGKQSRGMSGRSGPVRNFPRVARINEVMREVIADQLDRIGDDRLGLLTITGITVDPDLRHATVWISALFADAGADGLIDILDEHRVPLQAAVAREIRMKRTPQLHFAVDPAITNGQKIEEIIRSLPPRLPENETDDETEVLDAENDDISDETDGDERDA
jgi:ribosome-binding factor A